MGVLLLLHLSKRRHVVEVAEEVAWTSRGTPWLRSRARKTPRREGGRKVNGITASHYRSSRIVYTMQSTECWSRGREVERYRISPKVMSPFGPKEKERENARVPSSRRALPRTV